MPESGPLGSVRGDRGNPVPYRDTSDDASKTFRRHLNRGLNPMTVIAYYILSTMDRRQPEDCARER